MSMKEPGRIPVALLDEVQARPQRQDSVSDQLNDLRMVANKLGMYDAADAIKQLFELDSLNGLEYGCHCDLEAGMEPDGCVIDNPELGGCPHAKPNMRKEQCKYWRVKGS